MTDQEKMNRGIEAALDACDFEAIRAVMDTPPKHYWRGEQKVPSVDRLRATAEDLASWAASRFNLHPVGAVKEPHGYGATGGLVVRVFAERTEIAYGKRNRKGDARQYTKSSVVQEAE